MRRIAITFFVIIIGFTRCQQPAVSENASAPSVIPKPVSFTVSTNTFSLNSNTPIRTDVSNAGLKRIADLYASELNALTNFNLQAESTSGTNNAVVLSIATLADSNDEAYELNITTNEVSIRANKPEGLYRALQTLKQFVLSSLPVSNNAVLLTGASISDSPTYPFRGAMLDVARHFFSVDDVKRFIDLIALYKMNVLHLHLSDDQGWRIQINSWPELTAKGGSTEVGGGKGGFYTQDDFKEIVRYANDRFITIIPEIDLPGHTNAALASYAELNCDGKARDLYTGTEVGFSTLCAQKDITFKFIDDVVSELAAISPGPYIHLGGDESHSTKKEDYIVFANRMQQIVQNHGKIMIGWEEIAQGTLLPETVVQYWSNAKYAHEAVGKGAKLIMSPATKVYLDMKYNAKTQLGQDWAAKIEIDSAYLWSLSSRVKGIGKENILGTEAPLWTETITTIDEIEYMVFPRLPAIAEVAWSREESRDWKNFKQRLGAQGRYFEILNIDYYHSKQVPWK